MSQTARILCRIGGVVLVLYGLIALGTAFNSREAGVAFWTLLIGAAAGAGGVWTFLAPGRQTINTIGIEQFRYRVSQGDQTVTYDVRATSAARSVIINEASAAGYRLSHADRKLLVFERITERRAGSSSDVAP